MVEEKNTAKKKKDDVILSEAKDLDSSVKSQNDKEKTVRGAKVKETVKKEVEKTKAPKVVKKEAKKADSKKDTIKEGESKKRSQLEKRGRKYQDSFKKLDKDKEYSLEEALKLVKETSTSKFDGSVEIHINLNIDPKNPDHQIRGSISLPAGLGKSKRVAVVCKEDRQKEAKDAGAEIVGGSELIEKIAKGETDFEVLVATPDIMGELAKAGKILGPKGLMPNPKDNTVTNDIKSTVSDIKRGRAEYRADSYGIVHSVVGKVSFDQAKLVENVEALLKEIHNIKPSSVKSNYVKSIYVTSTMGPSVRITEK